MKTFVKTDLAQISPPAQNLGGCSPPASPPPPRSYTYAKIDTKTLDQVIKINFI